VTATTVYTFDPTIPAGTPVATPYTAQLTFPVYQVDRIEVKVPAGWNGQVGFQLASMGQQVIPYQAGQWIVASGDDLAWDLAGQMTSGAWELIAYNLGIWTHTPYIRFLVEPVPAATAPAVTPSVAVATLSST
jgi:hypothetical protein